MFIRCRPASPADLDECLSKIRDFHEHTPNSRRDLLALWRSLLADGTAAFAVVEDCDAAPGERIVWFSFKVFVSDRFVRFMRTQMPPCISRQVLADRQGECLALLTLPELRRTNSETGLHMATLNYGGMRGEWVGPERDWVASKSVEWSWYSTGGYRLKSLYLEVYGEWEWAWAQGFGMRLQNDYGGQETRHPAGSPRLYGISRDEDTDCAGNPMSVLFRYQRPCFGFRPPEQELLLWAMMDITDEELAERLALATITVKKRWQSIYSRVAEADPALLGGSAAGDAKRGTEKKRRLLSYLRHHMEELRPYEPERGK